MCTITFVRSRPKAATMMIRTVMTSILIVAGKETVATAIDVEMAALRFFFALRLLLSFLLELLLLALANFLYLLREDTSITILFLYSFFSAPGYPRWLDTKRVVDESGPNEDGKSKL